MKRLVLILALAGCTDQPSHIPNPLLLPGQAVSNVVQNAGYNARRARVSNHVTTHHAAIITQIETGDGPDLALAYQLAWVAGAKQPAITRLLADDIALYRHDPEALVVALMVHGR